MKKEKLGIILFVLSFFLFTNISKAQGILDFLDYAEKNQDTSFGYSSDDKLVIKYLDTTNSSIDVESPVIKDGSIEVNSYLFIASEESTANGNPVAVRCFDNIQINGNKFRVNLDMSNLNKNKTYYIYARPINVYSGPEFNGSCTAEEAQEFLGNGFVGTDSTANGEDPCVNINANVYGKGDYCDNHNNNNGGGSNGETQIYSISNVTFNCNSNGTTTLSWNSFADVDIEVFLRNDNKGLFEQIGTVNSERKSYTFTPNTKDGHFSIRLEPVDGTQKINEDGHCLVSTTPEVTPTTPVKPPVVGPKENIMMIIIGTIVLYIVYRFATRKRS